MGGKERWWVKWGEEEGKVGRKGVWDGGEEGGKRLSVGKWNSKGKCRNDKEDDADSDGEV